MTKTKIVLPMVLLLFYKVRFEIVSCLWTNPGTNILIYPRSYKTSCIIVWNQMLLALIFMQSNICSSVQTCEITQTIRDSPLTLYLLFVLLYFPPASPFPVLLQRTDLQVDPNTKYIQRAVLIVKRKWNFIAGSWNGAQINNSCMKTGPRSDIANPRLCEISWRHKEKHHVANF
jgi:hypothetical protein